MAQGTPTYDLGSGDGTEAAGRSNANVVTEAMVADAGSRLGGNIPPGFFVGTAINESSLALNEHDTDLNEDGGVKRNTYGIYQLGTDEQSDAGVDGSLYDLDTSTRVFAYVSQKRLSAIMSAAGISDPSENTDCWAYLCWAHVQNLHEAINSINTYGMDWQAAQNRDQKPWFYNNMVPYAAVVKQKIDQYGAATGNSDNSGGSDPAWAPLVLIALLVGAALIIGKAV